MILGWDLDLTLVANFGDYMKQQQEKATILRSGEPYEAQPPPTYIFNPKALSILQQATSLRPQKVKAILLLTNNEHLEYLNEVLKQLHATLGIPKVFDRIMERKHPMREPQGDPTKSLANIKTMLQEAGIEFDESTLATDLFFFDDAEHHVIRDEIGENYIQITPPFRKGVKEDKTDFSRVYNALGTPLASGGRRKRITRRCRKN